MCKCGKPATLFCDECARAGVNLCAGCHRCVHVCAKCACVYVHVRARVRSLPFQQDHTTSAPRRAGGAEGMCPKHKERLQMVCDVDGEQLCLVCYTFDHKVRAWRRALLSVCACVVCVQVCVR